MWGTVFFLKLRVILELCGNGLLHTKIQDYKELMRNTFLGQSDVGLFILLQDVSSLFTFTIHKVFLLTGNNMACYYVKLTIYIVRSIL